jgi:transposase-like protein
MGGQIERFNDRLFLVKSQNSDAFYRVEWKKDKWVCNCQDYTKRKKPCKHIYAVNFLLNLPNILLLNIKASKKRCPYCGSNRTGPKGFRYNKSGAVRLRICKDCKRRFKDDLMIEMKGFKTLFAIIALDLYYKGLSLRSIQNHLWQIYGSNKSVSTIHRWIVKLNNLLSETLEEIRPELGDKWLGDETIVKIDGKEKYLWNIMDCDTRYYIVSVVTQGRSAKDALTVIKEAIQKAGKAPKQFVTDGLKSYAKALSKLQCTDIEHISNVGLRSKENNNRIEKLHGTIKSWIKAHRIIRSQPQILIDGYRLYYNFIRPHLALDNETPAKTKNSKWIHLVVDRN